jgi:hypothetical protein
MSNGASLRTPAIRARLFRMVSGRTSTVVIVWLLALPACRSNPTAPGGTPLANGRWSGNGACLSVTDVGCNLAVGCGHGQFSKPTVRPDGTFDIDGTYRVEVGPVSINPAPPAHFSGSVSGSTLILNVLPTVGSLPPASYLMAPSVPGDCPIPCV